MEKLTSIKFKWQHKGYTVRVRFDEATEKHIYLEWRDPQGKEIEDWNKHRFALDPLLNDLKTGGIPAWMPGKTLWSY